jgi:hypothetical protein
MPEFTRDEYDDKVFPELFAGKFKVMQTCETAEVFCVAEFSTEGAAWHWIDLNADNYPESSFHVQQGE